MKDRANFCSGVSRAINVAGFLIQITEDKIEQLEMLKAVQMYFNKVSTNLDSYKYGKDLVLCCLEKNPVDV